VCLYRSALRCKQIELPHGSPKSVWTQHKIYIYFFSRRFTEIGWPRILYGLAGGKRFLDTLDYSGRWPSSYGRKTVVRFVEQVFT